MLAEALQSSNISHSLESCLAIQLKLFETISWIKFNSLRFRVKYYPEVGMGLSCTLHIAQIPKNCYALHIAWRRKNHHFLDCKGPTALAGPSAGWALKTKSFYRAANPNWLEDSIWIQEAAVINLYQCTVKSFQISKCIINQHRMIVLLWRKIIKDKTFSFSKELNKITEQMILNANAHFVLSSLDKFSKKAGVGLRQT